MRRESERLAALRLRPEALLQRIATARGRVDALDRLRRSLDPEAPLLRGYVLVTDAAHMRRSLAVFRATGLEVIPAPCNYFAGRFRWSPQMLLPASGALDNVDYAAHEWLGLAWYRLHGRL